MRTRRRALRLDRNRVPGLRELDARCARTILKQGVLVELKPGMETQPTESHTGSAYLIVEGKATLHDDTGVFCVRRGEFAGNLSQTQDPSGLSLLSSSREALAVVWSSRDFHALRSRFPQFDRLVATTTSQKRCRVEPAVVKPVHPLPGESRTPTTFWDQVPLCPDWPELN